MGIPALSTHFYFFPLTFFRSLQFLFANRYGVQSPGSLLELQL